MRQAEDVSLDVPVKCSELDGEGVGNGDREVRMEETTVA
jgi:hypothetical protein